MFHRSLAGLTVVLRIVSWSCWCTGTGERLETKLTDQRETRRIAVVRMRKGTYGGMRRSCEDFQFALETRSQCHSWPENQAMNVMQPILNIDILHGTDGQDCSRCCNSDDDRCSARERNESMVRSVGSDSQWKGKGILCARTKEHAVVHGRGPTYVRGVGTNTFQFLHLQPFVV